MNIIITGMMGSGKTTTAKKLSKKTLLTFLDTDNEIEKDQGCAIDQIFLYAGEPFFRQLEHKKLKEVMGYQNHVISTGGGIIQSAENRKLIKQLGKSVYIKASVDSLYQRLKNDKTRPLLQKIDIKTRLKELLEQREPFYLEADLVIEANNIDARKICYEIMRFFQLEPKTAQKNI